MDQAYDLGNIRTLLTQGFSDPELRRFCQDSPDFRAVYDDLSRGMGKAEVVDRLLDYAESQMLVDLLLAWAREKNPRRYKLHGPYVETRESGEGEEPDAGDQGPIRILFLAANPIDTTRLRLDVEVRAIKEALRGAEFRSRFDLEQEWAVRTADLQRCLLQHKPHVVHFSGHGDTPTWTGAAGAGGRAEVSAPDAPGERHLHLENGQEEISSGLLLEDDWGRSYEVPPKALSTLFGLLKGNIRCVVLNACYSEPQARAIAEHIDCVIGMSTAIMDGTAIRFSAAFYQALGYGQDVETAFKLGCNELDLQNMDDAHTPKLIATRCDPKTVVLVHGV